MENRFADTQLFLTHPKASQSENGLTGNLSNRCVRSEQTPNSSTINVSSCPEIPPQEPSLVSEGYTFADTQTRANQYLGAFYQFFG
jgi:hypothetical protein